MNLKLDKLKQLVNTLDIKHLTAIIKSQYKDIYQFVMENTTYMSKYNYRFTQRIYNVIHNLNDFLTCAHCNAKLDLLRHFKGFNNGYQLHCNNKCAQSDIKIIQKKEQTCLKNYGTTSFLKSDIGKEKLKQFYRDNYGCENAFQVSAIKKKIKEKHILTYGCDNPMHNKHLVYEKFTLPAAKQLYNKLLNVQQYVQPLFTIYDIANKNISEYNWLCHTCNNQFISTIDSNYWLKHKLNVHKTYARCPYCFPKMNWSFAEKEIYEYVKSIVDCNVYWQTDINRQIIYPLELDIWIPTLNIAIEYNGTWFHSIEHAEKEGNNKVYNRELYKTQLCEKQNILLIHIFEDEWEFNKQNTKQLIIDILTKQYENSFTADLITIDRSKFSLARTPQDYKLVDIIPASIDIRSTNDLDDKYHVFNCGMLVYKKSNNV